MRGCDRDPSGRGRGRGDVLSVNDREYVENVRHARRASRAPHGCGHGGHGDHDHGGGGHRDRDDGHVRRVNVCDRTLCPPLRALQRVPHPRPRARNEEQRIQQRPVESSTLGAYCVCRTPHPRVEIEAVA
jgi:hypothetical protein